MKSRMTYIFSITLLLSSFCYGSQQESMWRKPTGAEIETIQTAVAANDARKLHELGEQGILCNINDPEGAPLLIATHLNIDTVSALVANKASLLKKHRGNTVLEHITYNALVAQEEQFHARKRIFDFVITFHSRIANQHSDLKKLQQFIKRSKNNNVTHKEFLMKAIEETLYPQTALQSPAIIQKQREMQRPAVIMPENTVISDTMDHLGLQFRTVTPPIETAALERIPTPVIPETTIEDEEEKRDLEGFIILEDIEQKAQDADEEFEVVTEIPKVPTITQSTGWWPFW